MIGSIAECIFSTLLHRTRIIASICHRVAVAIVWTIIIRLTFWMFLSFITVATAVQPVTILNRANTVASIINN